MRVDHPATSFWLDRTAQRCMSRLNLRPAQIEVLRELLAKALAEFPDEAIEADMMAGMYGVLARARRQSMPGDAWEIWNKACLMYRRVGSRYLQEPGDFRDQWLEMGLAWFERASGTTLHQPVRLVKQLGRPRDMLVSTIEIMCNRGETDGYAVLEAAVYRPPRTSPCQIFTPGDQLHPLEWAELPLRARQDAGHL